MKGIIVEINRNHAAILSDDGMITKVKNDNYEIGQVISIKKSKKFGSKFIAGAATLVAAAAICTIGGYAYYTPTDYVSLDVNPSIEYSVNVFDRILDVTAVNDDGKEILTSLSLENKTIQDALKETIDQLIADGFLSNDPNAGVIITTSNKDMDQAEELAEDLQDQVQDYIDDNTEITADVQAEAVGLARVKEAKAMGVTPGKLNLVEKLQASTSGAIDVEEWLDKPGKEINKVIKENRKLEKDLLKDVDDSDLTDNDGGNPAKPEKIKTDNQNQNTNSNDTNKGNKNIDEKVENQNDPNEQVPDQELETNQTGNNPGQGPANVNPPSDKPSKDRSSNSQSSDGRDKD